MQGAGEASGAKGDGGMETQDGRIGAVRGGCFAACARSDMRGGRGLLVFTPFDVLRDRRANTGSQRHVGEEGKDGNTPG